MSALALSTPLLTRGKPLSSFAIHEDLGTLEGASLTQRESTLVSDRNISSCFSLTSHLQ